jgi:hypothetical protein
MAWPTQQPRTGGSLGGLSGLPGRSLTPGATLPGRSLSLIPQSVTHPKFGRLQSEDDLPEPDYNGVHVQIDQKKGVGPRVIGLEQAKERYRRNLIKKFGMTELGAQAATEIAYQRKKHGGSRATSLLGKVGRVLDIPSEATGGFIAGMYRNKYAKSYNPWDFIRHGHEIFAEGGRGAAEYVSQKKNWGETLKELDPDVLGNADPFAKRHAGSVGFGMSIIADPTVYLSGGATIGSKLAARQMIAHSFKTAADDAAKRLAAGEGAARFGGQIYKDHLALTQAIRNAGGREAFPQTMGDALDVLAKQGIERKAQLRRFERPTTLTRKGEEVPERFLPLKVAGAYIAPGAVKGGRGIRFAGKEIPGTAKVTEGIGRKFRTDVEDLVAKGNPVAQAIGSGFVTHNGLRMFGEDTIRALAMTEMNSFRTMELGTKAAAREQGLEIARAGGKKPVAPAERVGALDLKYEKAVLPLQRSVVRAYDAPHNASILPKDQIMSGQRFTVHGIPDRNYQDFAQQIKGWGADQQKIAGKALEATVAEGGNVLAVHGPDGELRAIGSFTDAGGGAVDVHFVASKGGYGGAQWLRKLAQEYPGHRFNLTAWGGETGKSDKLYKYYSKMGAKLEEGSTPGANAEMFFDEAAVDRIAAGKHPVEPYSVLKGGTPEQRFMRERIDAGRQEVLALGKKVDIPEKEMLDDWNAIKSTVKDPVEAYTQWWFKTQMKIRARQFHTHLLNNPILAKKVGKDAAADQGFTIVTDPVTGQRYQVMAQLDQAMQELINPVVMDKSIDHVLHALSIPQNYWKQFATSANPSFHVMNFLGAFWNNLFAGIYNPADYVKAATTLYQSRMAEAEAAGRARYMGRSTTPKNEAQRAIRANSADLVNEARIRGATSENASIYSLMVEEGINPKEVGMTPILPHLPTSVSERLKTVAKPAPGQSKKGFTLQTARRGTAAAMAAHGNVPVAALLLAPEAAKAGRVVGNTIEDVVRLAPFMKAAKDPQILRYIDAFGPPRVPGMRHPGWTKEQQSALYDIGAALSKHFQFDYSDLTVFERRMAKLIFPFYVFNKKNFLLQAQLLAQSPRGVRIATGAMNYANDNGDISPEFKNLLPTYFDQIQAFQIPVPDWARDKMGLPKGEPLFLNPKLPFMSLNLFPPIWQMFQDTGQPTNQKVLAQLSSAWGMVGPWAGLPGLKPIMEASVGMSLGLNKSLDYQRSQSNNYRDSYVPAPTWIHWVPKPIRNIMGVFPWGKTVKGKQGDLLMPATGKYILDQVSTPYITNLGQSIPYEGQDPGKARADMVSWMTGLRLIPVDALQIHRSYAYQMKSMLEAERQALKAQGKELSVQDQNTLDMTRESIKALEEAWDIRDAELHGKPLP